MPRSKVKKSNKKHVTLEFKTKVEWTKHRLRPGSQRYNKMTKKHFGISPNTYYDSMTDAEKQSKRDAEQASVNAAKTYTDYAKRTSAYARALKKLHQDGAFISGSHEERIKMMIEAEPELANALSPDGTTFDLRMTLSAYEDRERLINTGEYTVMQNKKYRDNYLEAIRLSNMPVPSNIKDAIRDIPDEDLEYFMNELMPALPDWYGINQSTLMPAIEFIQKLQSAVDFYNNQKG